MKCIESGPFPGGKVFADLAEIEGEKGGQATIISSRFPPETCSLRRIFTKEIRVLSIINEFEPSGY